MLVLGAIVAALSAGAAAGEGGTAPFRRVGSNLCAEAALPARVGRCPRSVPVFFGRLAPGTCAELGFRVPAGVKRVLAGPCGWLSFDLFAEERPAVAVPSEELVAVGPAEVLLGVPMARRLLWRGPPRSARRLSARRLWRPAHADGTCTR